MRILQIIPSIALIYGGPSQAVMGLSAALAAAGVDVTVLTTDSNGDTGQAPLDVPLESPVKQDGYEIYYFRCAPFRRYKFSLNLLRWLAKHSHHYDLVHIHALFSPVSTAAATVARSKKLPYVLRPLGTLDPADLQKKRHLKTFYAALLERPNLAGAAAIHFTSDQEAKISDRFNTLTKDLVIPLGVTLPKPADHSFRSRAGIPNDRPLLLFMSRIDPKKGLDLLIPALETLAHAGHAFQFVLAGANPQDLAYEEKIRSQIRSSILHDRTILTGFVSGDEKTALLQAADLFILPSYYENFGIAVAEAMVAGTPVVISDQVHIWQDIRRSEAGWISACTVESLTETLRIALSNRAEQQRRGLNAQAHAQKFYSWDTIARQMIQAYSHILRED